MCKLNKRLVNIYRKRIFTQTLKISKISYEYKIAILNYEKNIYILYFKISNLSLSN